MKHYYFVIVFIILMLSAFFLFKRISMVNSYCLTGAFLADNPTREDISNFKSAYGKKPFLVMIFIGWDSFPKEETVKNIYSEGSVMVVTWEPWNPANAEAIDYDKLLSGGYDSYINSFAGQIKSIPGQVFIRFAHEANGNWYPWAADKIGKEKYLAVYRYVKDKFDAFGVKNAKWIFSVNHEDVPQDSVNNCFLNYYPGDKYVDYVGIDGYNWGNTKPWSRWMSFKEIFSNCYNEIAEFFKKPVLISEFSSTSSGGDKSLWIKQALCNIKEMKHIRGFILFNHNKETDWSFVPGTSAGTQLRQGLKNSYFKEKVN